MRVAEEVAMLDNMSNGRMILGIGRGLGRVEFEGFGRDMNVMIADISPKARR